MGIIRDYRDAVLTTIAAGVPELKEVSSSPGTFTEDTIRRFAMKSPCCKVAFLGARRMELLSTGEWSGIVNMAAYIIAEDEPPLESYDVAMDLAEKIAGVIESTTPFTVVEGEQVPFSRAGNAQVEEIENLYSIVGEKRGSSMIAVSWRQQLRFGVDTYAADVAGEPALGVLNPDGLIMHGPFGETIP